MKLRILDAAKRKTIRKMLKSQYGADEGFGGVLVQAGGSKLRVTTAESIEVASKMRGVHSVGLYVAKLTAGNLVLSIEGAQLLCSHVKRNVVELSSELAWSWMSGAPIHVDAKTKSRYVIGRTGRDCLGCGRLTRGVAHPQVAKSRRLPPGTQKLGGRPEEEAE